MRRVKPIPTNIKDVLELAPSLQSGLRWKKGTRRAGSEAGSLDKNNYYVIRYRHKAYKAHRIIWFLLTGIDDLSKYVDHIDGNSANNNYSNLRLASPRENTLNRKPQGNRRYKGTTLAVNTFKKPWRTDIKVYGKSITIGTYETEQEAAKAYNKAALQYYGEFARLNNV